MRSRSGTALGAVLVIGLGAACAAPGPSAPASVALASTPPSAPAADPSSLDASATPATLDPPELGTALEVQALDRATTERIDVFASTGSAVVFAAGLSPDAAPGTAPDLWRVTPGASPEPELVWRNPGRDHGLTSIVGDLDTVAFVDLPLDGSRAWSLWVVPRDGDPVLLDTHPGDEEVPSLVPSVAVYEPAVAWTAHDRGPDGPVSQLLVASAPDWTPQLIEERAAAQAELWLPSLRGQQLAYAEVVYALDRSSDERHVYLASIAPDAGDPMRLDASGRATMPLVTENAVLWKEAERGMNMFNWGRMWRYDLETGRISSIRPHPQTWVNYPSAGSRFVAWWGSDSSAFGVYDLGRDEPRVIERYDPRGIQHVLRPHVSGDLLAWLYVEDEPARGGSWAELRYAWLPNAKELDR